MKIGGIIAEYNPLHLGHAYHIEETKKICDLIIVVMSGSFVQRGEIAAFDKFDRAKWALEAGADLVLELPTVFVLQSAEAFASGGVRILADAGVNILSFGSEISDLSLLKEAASFIEHEGQTMRENIKAALKNGESFPRARHSAAREIGTDDRLLSALEQPNFLLGAEYTRAIHKYATNMQIFAVPRKGQTHDQLGETDSEFLSASKIRQLLKESCEYSKSARSLMSSSSSQFAAYSEYCESFESAESALLRASQSVPGYVKPELEAFASQESLENVFLYAVRNLNAESASKLFGAVEGLDNLLIRSADYPSLEEAIFSCKSKRYTLARIRRLFCAAVLSMRHETVMHANSLGNPYFRVLGFRKNARPLLRRLSDSEHPLLIKKRDFDMLQGLQREIADLDIRANNLQALAFSSSEKRKSKRDFTSSLTII